MIKREQIYEAFDNGLIGLDDIINICYNNAIDDFSEKIKYEYGNYEIHETIDEIAERLKGFIC